jgi:CheY-like chemotaxis protein
MDGREAYEQLSKIRPGLPVVFSSGYMEVEELEPLCRLPHVEFIQKPYSIHALHAAMDRLLGLIDSECRADSGGG